MMKSRPAPKAKPLLPLTDATAPTVVPAAPEKTYGSWVLTSFMLTAGDPTSGKYAASAEMRKAFNKGDGTLDVSSVDPVVQLLIPDIFALAAEDPQLIAVMTALVAYIGDYGKAHGKL